MSEESPRLPAGCDILLLEDDAPLRRRLAAHLEHLGAHVSLATGVAEARRLLATGRFEFALIDLHLPDGEGLDLLREGAFSETTGVVVMTAFGGVKQAVEAIKLGAGDYLSKPFEAEELPLAFLRCQKTRGSARQAEHQAHEVEAEAESLLFSPGLSALRTQLEAVIAAEHRVRATLPPVLIEGETGTGKSALARWLHRHGPRAAQPFIALNCAALPDTLAEAELFGHERGAFTDARRARIGLFEAADGGTLFLDEIAFLAPAIQAKVLVAVEEGSIRRLGDTREIKVNARLIAASNRPLAEQVKTGAFRNDLYQRLNFLRIEVPPLRERSGDIVPLARHLLDRIAGRHRLTGLTLSAAGETALCRQPWRGNVRELAHEIERAVIFGAAGPLDFAHLNSEGEARSPPALVPRTNRPLTLPESGLSLDAAIDELIASALSQTNHNVSAAARRLGVTREFLRHRLKSEPTDSTD
jgi:DNA-binding NtrC family response regulator